MSSIESTVFEKPSSHEMEDGSNGFSDHYIRVGNTKARYWVGGARLGTPVLFLHGFGASVQIWSSVLKALAQQYRVVAVDLPGFGLSDKPDSSYSLAYMANFVRDFLDAIDVSQVVLVGHSYGGAVSLRFALDFPQRVERLALIAPAAIGRRANPLLRLMTLPGVGELLSLPSRVGTRMLIRMATYNRAAVPESLVEETYQLSRLPGAQQGFLRTLRTAGNVFGQRRAFYVPIQHRLQQIAIPTLVLWGCQDRIVPEASQTARSIPGAHVETWDACGHLPWLEYFEKFNILLRDFLAQTR